MKKVVLVVSHAGSGSGELCKILGQNPLVHFPDLRQTYNHPEALDVLTASGHKCATHEATWGAELLYNQQFASKALYGMCKFIYVVRNAKCLEGGMTPGHLRYYCYRLRRICEMARRTPGAVLATWDDMVTGRCFPFLEEYLGLREPLARLGLGEAARGAEPAWGARAYERYLHFLRRGCRLQWDGGFGAAL